MPPNPSNSAPSPTPPPLDEAAMLAWIEGRLSKIEESKLIKQARPGTAERVTQMQANRRALQTVRDERAPAELMDRVLAALEREALVGLANGQDLYEHPPISIAAAKKTSGRAPWAQRHAPALALAAGLALLLTGAIYWGSLLFKPTPKNTPLANNTETTPTPIPAEPTRVADANTGTPSTVSGAPEAPKTMALAKSDNTSEPPTIAPAMTPGRMLALAREGRLVMRVQSRDLKNLPDVAAVEKTTKLERSWHLTSDVPSSVIAAIVPHATPTGTTPTPERTGPTYASAKERAAAIVAPLIGPGAGMTWALSASTDPASRVRGTFIIDLPNTEKSLNQIKVLFKDRLKADVIFEELDQAVEVPKAEDPETLLWWTLPPAQWVEHVAVPVVVEAR